VGHESAGSEKASRIYIARKKAEYEPVYISFERERFVQFVIEDGITFFETNE
jgi:hypothetical protein